MRRIVAIIVFTGWFNTSLAQYFQFSQYNFTPQRINPGQVSNSDYAALSFDYRNQATEGGFHLTSNILNLSYPIFSRNGQRWSGVGLTFLDDRSGQAGIFNTQEVGLSYALHVPIAKFQTLSLGVKGLYQNRKIDLDGLFTGSQYVPDRGFNEALSSGENTGQFDADFLTFSAGLYWEQTDKEGMRLAYWGVSFFDFNKPDNSFFGLQSHLNSTFVATLGFRVYERGNLSIFPEVLYTRSAFTNVLNAGCITRYALSQNSVRGNAYLNIITKYVVGRSGIIGLQLGKENLTIGLSYDFPVIATNVANTGAVEVGVELRKLVIPRKKIKRKKSKETVRVTPTQVKKSPVKIKTEVPNQPAKAAIQMDSAGARSEGIQNLSERLHHKGDSIKATVEPGKFRHEALILEKATLDFTFDFNSAEVNQRTELYLRDLAQALRDNPELSVRLVGHTDNIGSDGFNLKLSFYRAQKIKDYLIGEGVPASRISIDGKGKKEPLNDNSTEEKRALNRRVELTILYN